MFEELGIPLQKRVGFQVDDEIGRNTLVGCRFTVTKHRSASSEQGPQPPFGPVPRSTSTSSTPTFHTLVRDQILFKGEISAMKGEKALNAKHHENLLSAFSALTAKFTFSSSSF